MDQAAFDRLAKHEADPVECECEMNDGGTIVGRYPGAEATEWFTDKLWYCQNCYHEDVEEEFVPSDGNPAPHICPKCGLTDCFEKELA